MDRLTEVRIRIRAVKAELAKLEDLELSILIHEAKGSGPEQPGQFLKLTNEEIEAARSPRGGWTRATLAKWGVPWPPPGGWRRALINGEPIPLPKEQALRPEPNNQPAPSGRGPQWERTTIRPENEADSECPFDLE